MPDHLLTDAALYAWFLAQSLCFVGKAANPDYCPMAEACRELCGINVSVGNLTIEALILDEDGDITGEIDEWPTSDAQNRFVTMIDNAYATDDWITGHAACLTLEEAGRLGMLDVMWEA